MSTDTHKNSSELKNSESEFLYYSNPTLGKSRVVVAGKHENGVLAVSVAKCGRKDTFNKQIGKSIAQGRLNKKHYFAKIEKESVSGKEFMEIASTICAVVNTQTNVKLKKK